jgi:hypothetical protein
LQPLARRAEAVNRDCAVVHLGVGAFNLVRTSAYRALGGHVPLRMEVVDDLKLALLVKRAGGRSRAYFAPRDADADWCASLWGLVRDLEKNHFAVTGYRLTPVIVGAVALVGLATKIARNYGMLANHSFILGMVPPIEDGRRAVLRPGCLYVRGYLFPAALIARFK